MSSNATDWDLPTSDIIWSWFGWFAFVYAIFSIPAAAVMSSAIVWTVERSAKVGNIWLAYFFSKLFGASLGLFYFVGWFVMYAFIASAAFVVWNEELWQGAGAELGLMVASWVFAALWMPVYMARWPYSAKYSLAPILIAFASGLAATILTWIEVTSFAWLFIPYLAWLALAFYTVARQPYVQQFWTKRHTEKHTWENAPLSQMAMVPEPPAVWAWDESYAYHSLETETGAHREVDYTDDAFGSTR